SAQIVRGELDAVERLAKRRKELVPRRREVDRAMAAHKQPRREMLLQRRHVAAHRALRNAKLGRGAGKAVVPRSCLEGAHCIEWRQMSPHGSSPNCFFMSLSTGFETG